MECEAWWLSEMMWNNDTPLKLHHAILGELEAAQGKLFPLFPERSLGRAFVTIDDKYLKKHGIDMGAFKGLGKREVGPAIKTDGIQIQYHFFTPKDDDDIRTVKKARVAERTGINITTVKRGMFKLEELDRQYKPSEFMVCDPGQKTLLKSDTLAYSSKQWRHDSGQTERLRKTRLWDKPLEVSLHTLSNASLHTSMASSYRARLRIHAKEWLKLLPEYQSRRRARLGFDTRMKKQRCLDKLAQKLVGNGKALFVGDASWSPGLRGTPPGPVTMIRNHLSRKGCVVLVPEFMTTQACSHCHKRMVHAKNHDHGLYCCGSCYTTWNRDFNAHRNQLACVEAHYAGRRRPLYLSRDGPLAKTTNAAGHLSEARMHDLSTGR